MTPEAATPSREALSNDNRPLRFVPLTTADMARLKADIQKFSWPCQISEAYGISEDRAIELTARYSNK